LKLFASIAIINPSHCHPVDETDMYMWE